MGLALLPILLSLLGVFLIIVTAVVSFYKSCFTYWKKRGVKYLEPTIPFGNASNLFLGKTNFGGLFRNWYLEMKERGWSMGGAYYCGKPVLVPIDNELIKKIMISEFIVFPNHGFYIDNKKEPFSAHIFNMEGYKWKNLRSKLPAAFTAAKMRQHVVVMEKISREFVKRLNDYAMEKKPVNIKEMLSKFTIDIIASCAFGMESKTLNNENEELVKQSRPFFESQWSRTSNTFQLLVPRHILSLVNFKLFPAETTKYFMNMFRRIKEHREKESIKRDDLTDLLMELCDETKQHRDFSGKEMMEPLTFNEFATQMYVFFEAGFETSSSTQTFTLYELAVNPEIQDKLRAEIDQVLEKYDGEVGYESINEMEYLDRIVDETLRKYPIFPILPRVCTKDYPIPETNVVIEKDTFIMITNWGVQCDSEYYPNPEKFDPERFTTENKAKRPHCSYIPFGEGPRICVGKRFGIWQTKIGIVSVVKNYKISVSKKMQLPLSFDESKIVLRAKGDVWLDLEKMNY